ncbi:sigma-70 family RNA polymerase sigma factor [Psychrobacillus sp. MER TA 171]|uniref:sigma-70 family RNA polymerase sigma factor n=1 Tax=Psychrobacillus sp. MER TA 171 TaxID=2939577 RepID=UPI0020407A38|nr:sigma-70 family RNA polymerase sigma factor [Psychrobacillus sp. MER TA 171]MCM3359444.1 sigma-70 family RNA polymerase sigma factor [Psychrobacillus sp. MER TA 171]
MDQLIKEAINGDSEAFAQLLKLERPRLLAKAYTYTGNREDAEDLVQETFIKAFHSLHQLNQPNYFSTWLFKILIHESYAYLSKRKRTLAIEVKKMEQEKVTNSEYSSFEALYEALATLKYEYRTAIVLYYFYHFSIAEISSMLVKPVNTIKIHLYRGRHLLKQNLQQSSHLPYKKEGLEKLLKEELSKLAITFVDIPQHLDLQIEDYQEDRAYYLWTGEEMEEGVGVTLDVNGKLLALAINPTKRAARVTIQEQQLMAEQFLIAQYKEALNYLSLLEVTEKEDRTAFVFAQYVHGYPLQKHQTFIEVSHNGEIITFYYKGYTTTPPDYPSNIIKKSNIINRYVKLGDWQLKLCYLSEDMYDIEKAGIYQIYENNSLLHTFNASTGDVDFPEEKDQDDNQIVPFPNMQPGKKQTTIRRIIGIPDTMNLQRKLEKGNDIWEVWQDEASEKFQDTSLDSYLHNMTENTVKFKYDKETKELKEFVWFKERTGALQLDYEQCKQIACQFIVTYFESFIPYLSYKLKEPSFNEANRAIFEFPIHNGNGMRIEAEQISIIVNRTTGLIEACTTPLVTIEELKDFIKKPVITTNLLHKSFDQIDACLKWTVHYDSDQPYETLQYKLRSKEKKQVIAGIEATTGRLICYKR